jgi:hypothetical protein
VTGDKLKLYFFIGMISGSYHAQATKLVTSASVGALSRLKALAPLAVLIPLKEPRSLCSSTGSLKIRGRAKGQGDRPKPTLPAMIF